jgi:hypothetical protein
MGEGEWFNDDEVNDLLTKLLDRLCQLERMGGEIFGSTLVFIANGHKYPVLYATEGKPFYPQEHLTDLDVEIGIKVALKARWK